jgi:sodium/bile acid cotransporter 7
MNSYFLPAGLLLALTMAMFEPAPGRVLYEIGLVPWMVVTIFLVNGYQIDLTQLPRASRVLRASIVGVVISLLISPLIGLAVVALFSMPADIALGMVVMATVPPTLTAGIVMTRVAGGNAAKALFLTILLNLVGVFTIPFMLQLTLGSAGLVSISPLPMFKQLVLLVLVPFIFGAALRSFIRAPSIQWLLRFLPSSCVIATVWVSASASSDMLKGLDPGSLLLVLAGAFGIHGALLLLCWVSRFIYRPEHGEWLALLFTASQKTLPIALGVLALIDQAVGVAIVCCIIFHFLQLLIDSMIASRMARSGGGATST